MKTPVSQYVQAQGHAYLVLGYVTESSSPLADSAVGYSDSEAGQKVFCLPPRSFLLGCCQVLLDFDFFVIDFTYSVLHCRQLTVHGTQQHSWLPKNKQTNEVRQSVEVETHKCPEHLKLH